MDYIDISPLVSQFSDHLEINDRTIFSARFGDGKSYFLEEFMRSTKKQFEYIVLYPINYQIASNEAIMEYIKRDILLQLIIKGHITPDLDIPDHILFQWYLTQRSENLFKDVTRFITSLLPEGSDWGMAMKALMAVSEAITKGMKQFENYKDRFKEASVFQQGVDMIEQMSQGKGNIYELDMVTYFIVHTLQQISNNGRKTVLIIEDMDRIDPAHLFRVLNVFSAHIDRHYQCSTYKVLDNEGQDLPIDELRNKFGFDKIVMVMDYDTTRHIYSHFYGEKANYQGYIGKFLSHSVFRYSISDYAFQQLGKHLVEKCNLTLDQIFCKIDDKYRFINPADISVRCIARILDSFDKSIMNVPVFVNSNFKFNASTPLTKAIATLRRMGLEDKLILELITYSFDNKALIDMFGLYLVENVHVQHGITVYYKRKTYQFYVETEKDGYLRFLNSQENEPRQPEFYEFMKIDIDKAFYKACEFVK